MNKSDLKTGMMVVTRDGDKYMVMLNVEYATEFKESLNVIVSEDGWMPLWRFSKDLKLNANDTSELDIVAVYSPKMTASLWKKNIKDDDYWECIWKREESPVEMTIAEIEKKLDIKNLKIIKEHENE